MRHGRWPDLRSAGPVHVRKVLHERQRGGSTVHRRRRLPDVRGLDARSVLRKLHAPHVFARIQVSPGLHGFQPMRYRLGRNLLHLGSSRGTESERDRPLPQQHYHAHDSCRPQHLSQDLRPIHGLQYSGRGNMLWGTVQYQLPEDMPNQRGLLLSNLL